MIFISEPVNGRVYIAETSRKGARKLLWSVMPEKVPENDRESGADVRISPTQVPIAIRRQAYRKQYKLRHLEPNPQPQENRPRE